MFFSTFTIKREHFMYIVSNVNIPFSTDKVPPRPPMPRDLAPPRPPPPETDTEDDEAFPTPQANQPIMVGNLRFSCCDDASVLYVCQSVTHVYLIVFPPTDGSSRAPHGREGMVEQGQRHHRSSKEDGTPNGQTVSTCQVRQNDALTYKALAGAMIEFAVVLCTVIFQVIPTI